MSVKSSQQHMSSQHDSIRGTTPKDIHFPLFFKPPGIVKSCYTLETAFPRLNTPVTRLTISSSHKLQPGRDTKHAHTHPSPPFDRSIHPSIQVDSSTKYSSLFLNIHTLKVATAHTMENLRPEPYRNKHPEHPATAGYSNACLV